MMNTAKPPVAAVFLIALSVSACANAPEVAREPRPAAERVVADGADVHAATGGEGEDGAERATIAPAPAEALPDWGEITAPWEPWQLERGGAPALDVFVARDDTPRPLVVLLQGSGCVPLFFEVERDGARGVGTSLMFWREVAAGEQPVHFAAVEKRGVTSFGPPPRGPFGTAKGCSQAYVEGAVKPKRVADVVAVVRALADKPWVDGVLIAGHSEGAAVASGVAEVLGDRLAAVGLFSAAGPSQLVDFAIYAHRSGDPDRVAATFEDILNLTGPEMTGAWRGHDMSRWRTFAIRTSPLDELRNQAVPVFVAHGVEDTSSPVESADMFVVELLREGPSRPVFYLRMEDVDHGLLSADDDNLQAMVLQRFLRWALSESSQRGVEVWRASASP